MMSATARIAGSAYQLKTVINDGNRNRIEDLTRLFYENIQTHYGSQDSLLREIQANETMRSRLLVAREKYCGVLVHARTPKDHEGLKGCLEIKAFFGRDYDSRAELLKEVLNYAKHENADFIGFHAAKSDTQTVQFFEQNQFRLSPTKIQTPQFAFYVQSLRADMDKKKRSLEQTQAQTPPPPPPAAAAAASSSSSSSSSYSSNGKEEVKKRRVEYDGVPKVGSSKKATELKARYEEYIRTQKLIPFTIKRKYFQMIQNGSKTVEGRINNGFFKNLKVGQFLDVSCGNEHVTCEIGGIVAYRSFSEMLEKEGIKNCLPDVQTLEEGVRVYHSIPNYQQNSERCGVLALRLCRMDH